MIGDNERTIGSGNRVVSPAGAGSAVRLREDVPAERRFSGDARVVQSVGLSLDGFLCEVDVALLGARALLRYEQPEVLKQQLPSANSLGPKVRQRHIT